jgi:hypothetical protein
MVSVESWEHWYPINLGFSDTFDRSMHHHLESSRPRPYLGFFVTIVFTKTFASMIANEC